MSTGAASRTGWARSKQLTRNTTFTETISRRTTRRGLKCRGIDAAQPLGNTSSSCRQGSAYYDDDLEAHHGKMMRSSLSFFLELNHRALGGQDGMTPIYVLGHEHTKHFTLREPDRARTGYNGAMEAFEKVRYFFYPGSRTSSIAALHSYLSMKVNQWFEYWET